MCTSGHAPRGTTAGSLRLPHATPMHTDVPTTRHSKQSFWGYNSSCTIRAAHARQPTVRGPRQNPPLHWTHQCDFVNITFVLNWYPRIQKKSFAGPVDTRVCGPASGWLQSSHFFDKHLFIGMAFGDANGTTQAATLRGHTPRSTSARRRAHRIRKRARSGWEKGGGGGSKTYFYRSKDVGTGAGPEGFAPNQA